MIKLNEKRPYSKNKVAFYFGEIKTSTLGKNGANTREFECIGRFRARSACNRSEYPRVGSVTRESEPFTREFGANTREIDAFTREFEANTREFECYAKI